MVHATRTNTNARAVHTTIRQDYKLSNSVHHVQLAFIVTKKAKQLLPRNVVQVNWNLFSCVFYTENILNVTLANIFEVVITSLLNLFSVNFNSYEIDMS